MRAGWWWIDRWRLSLAYRDLTAAQQGAFRNLVDETILRGGAIPDNDADLSRACGDASIWPSLRDAVLAHFRRTDRGWGLSDPRICTPARAPRDVNSLHRRHIPLWIRRFVMKRDGRCVLCGSERLPELDHVVRYRDGGRDEIDNLRVLCKPCNVRRA